MKGNTVVSVRTPLTYRDRIEALRLTKLEQTRFKQSLGSRDTDDKGSVPLPPDWKGFTPKPNHPSGTFFGPRACGENFRAMLESHPTYIDPMSSLAGGWMLSFSEYRKLGWPPDPEFDYSHLHEDQRRYNIIPGIGGAQHFCPEVRIGLELGWGGLLEKVRRYRDLNHPADTGFYDGLEDVVLGVQNWIGRHASAARKAAEIETRPELRRNLLEMATMCERQVNDPPVTFREACQWIAWFEMVACMYNNSGALGQIDEVLRPYSERDMAAGTLTDEEAVWHLASLLIKETHYMQVGGPDPTGKKDLTSRVSFLVLEAAHLLRIPSNIAVRVHNKIDPALYDAAVRYLFEDKTGSPLWMGSEALDRGFARNGYPIELARERVKCGCHWCALPGREYTLNDIVKINFAAVFDVALHDMMGDLSITPSVAELWRRFEKHLRRAVEVTAEGIDFHLAHYKDVSPELVLDLLCFGPVEKGRDVSDGGVEFYNMCVDGAAIATVADSFAAVEQRVEQEKRLSWAELLAVLDSDYKDAEPVRLMLKTVPHYGTSGARANEWATRISQLFVRLVKEKPTPGGKNMIPGLFSWASTIPMGKAVGATPNGRHAHAPISHGPNPDLGWPKPLTPTALSRAVASVECGYGNTAPLQLDTDPGIGDTDATRGKIGALIRTHFDMGGTMINLNVLNKQQILEAHEDPSRYPELVVRVTGFSAYFASLSKEFRQLVVDRIVSEE